MNIYFTRETLIVNKLIRKCSVFISNMQIKIIMRYSYAPGEWLKLKTQNTKCLFRT